MTSHTQRSGRSILMVSSLAWGLALSLSGAEPEAKAAVKAAADQLAAQPNYSWTATTKLEGLNWRMGPVDGQTEKEGFTYVKMVLGDNTIETAFRGKKSAIKRQDTWESADELQDNNQWIARRLQTFRAPAGEAAALLETLKEVKPQAEGASGGDLTEAGAKDLFLMRARGEASTRPEPKDAKGWAKFWVKDGVLTKFEYQVEGTSARQGQDDVHVVRKVTTEMKAVGTTKVSVPDEAKKKLQ